MNNIRYKVAEYTHKGTNHIEGYNQDYISIRAMKNGIIVASADGCSSEPLSGVGGYFLCEAITSAFAESVDNISHHPLKNIKLTIDQLIAKKLGYLCDSIQGVVQRNFINGEVPYIPAHLFSCTLLVALCFNTGRQIIYHIGDGVILGRRKDNDKVEVLSPGKNIGYQSRTYFATDYDFAESAFVKEYRDGTYTDLFLTTDGLQKALTEGNDSLSNLKSLVESLSNYGNTFNEEFNNHIEKLRKDATKTSPSRVEDDISCVWISEEYRHNFFTHDGDVSIKIDEKTKGTHKLKSIFAGKSRIVIKIKKKKSRATHKAPTILSVKRQKKTHNNPFHPPLDKKTMNIPPSNPCTTAQYSAVATKKETLSYDNNYQQTTFIIEKISSEP